MLAAVASKLAQLERERKALGSKQRRLRDLRGRVLRDGGAKTEDLTRWLLRGDREENAMTTLTRTSLGHFDESGLRVFRVAADEAKKYRHGWIGTEHLLLALAQLRDDALRAVLTANGLGIAAIRGAFETALAGSQKSESGIFITPRVQRIMGIAEGFALHDGRRAGAEDLLLAMLEDGEGLAVGLIRQCRGDPARIAASLRERIGWA